MAYKYLIMLDTEEGNPINPDKMFFTNDKNKIQRYVDQAANGQSTVMVMELNSIYKQKTKPTFQKYIYTPQGEFVPE